MPRAESVRDGIQRYSQGRGHGDLIACSKESGLYPGNSGEPLKGSEQSKCRKLLWQLYGGQGGGGGEPGSIKKQREETQHSRSGGTSLWPACRWCQVFIHDNTGFSCSSLPLRLLGPSELSEVKTFALPVSLQQEHGDGAQSLPWELTSLPKNTVTQSPAQAGNTVSPAPFLSFFLSRKVTLHLLWRCLSLDGVCIPSTCVCALQSSLLGFRVTGELQTGRFPPDAYLHSPLSECLAHQLSNCTVFRCQVACFKAWSFTGA